MAKIIDADDIAWEQTKLEYAQQDSLVDMGELYYWACKWHEKYHAQAEAIAIMREGTHGSVGGQVTSQCLDTVGVGSIPTSRVNKGGE